MKSFRSAALGLLAATAVAAASDVFDLKEDTFNDFVSTHPLVLAEFFAPWCGHCKALAPEYEEAATALKEKDIALAKIDCTEEADLCQKFGVEGYPTIKVFRGPDNNYPYGGQRKAQSIISYMTKQSLPAVSTVSKETLEEFKGADNVVVVAYYDAKDKAANETFGKVADGMRDDYLFGAITDADVATAEGAKQPSIVLYKQFDERKAIYTGPFEKEAIEAFTKMAATPLIGEVGPETYSNYMAAGVPLAYIFAETSEERTELATELKPIAQKHKGKVNFATIDAKAFGQHAQNLNLEVGKWPAFAIQETVKNQKYPFDQTKKITAKEIGPFVEDFVAGKATPSVKSEPIPEKQEGPVTVVVAHNYESVVMDESKDVLVEYYAPWCGHCKSLAPKYEQLAGLYTKFSDKVTIAKVDATANDVPEEIQGFPTIKLYPAGSNKVIVVDYSGDRSIKDMANFIRDNGSNKVDAWVEGTGDEPAGEDMPSQAPAATVTDAAKSVVSEAAEAVKTAVMDSDEGVDHNEL